MTSIEKAMDRHSEAAVHSDQKEAGHHSKDSLLPRSVHRINLADLQQQGFLIPDHGGHLLSEEYRMIKRPLLLNAFGKGASHIVHGNLVMVVSAISGEGKTFTTLNLAMSIAMERDTTVLMVDSDVVKPSLSGFLGLSGHLGLTDLLYDENLNLSEAIVNTDIQKLKVLPAGRTNVHSTELLASRRMEYLAKELSNRYPDRIVLFDSPPLLVTSQACVLSQIMGQILMVVEAGRVSQAAVKEALAMLDSDKVIGLILNKKPKSLFDQRYQPYGYGWDNNKKEDKKR